MDNLQKQYINHFDSVSDYTFNLIKIYKSSEHLQTILSDLDLENNIINSINAINELLKQSMLMLNLNIKYNIFINYLVNLLDIPANINFTEENVLIYVTLYDYFMLKTPFDLIDDFVVNDFILNKIMFYDKLYVYEPINKYILNKLSKQNFVKNETFEYIFNINKNLCNDITTLYSTYIKQKLLDKCLFITSLNINGNNNIFNINHLQNTLIELDISKCDKIYNNGISKLLKLERLNLSRNDRIHQIKHFHLLEELNIAYCVIPQHEIKNLLKLKKLNVCYNNPEEDTYAKKYGYECNIKNIHHPQISNVNHLQQLTHLDISGFCCVDQDGISDLKLITNLNANCNGKITDVNHLTKLEDLNISGGSCCQDGFTNCLNIKKLNVEYNHKITNVNHLTKLEDLNISGSYCGVDQEGFTNCLNIKKLNIKYNEKITNTSHLKFLNELTK